MRRMLTLAAVLTLAIFCSGPKGCDDTGDDDSTPATPTADFTAADLDVALDFAIAGVDLGLLAASNEEDFEGCMVLTGIRTGFVAAQAYAPEIEAEVLASDGKLDFPSQQFDGTACTPLPDPWPPTEPDPQLEATVSPMVQSSLMMAATLIESQAPVSGQDCVRAHIAAAILRAWAEQTPAILQEAMVDADRIMPIAAFSVDYSGC